MTTVGAPASPCLTVLWPGVRTTNASTAPHDRKLTSAADAGIHVLRFTKPSWVVRTESNVRKEIMGKPDPQCVVCIGNGRVHCHCCKGRGRTNHIELELLPKGDWPKWCRNCGGSGMECCSRCLGTGEYRYIMGFKCMNNKDPDRVILRDQAVRRDSSQSFTGLLLNDADEF